MGSSRPRPTARSVLVGGLLPVLAFTLLEEWLGIAWGAAAGMAFGVGEIVWERLRYGKVETITWAGTVLLVLFGGVALATREGIWFKLQPALLQAAMGLGLLGTVVVRRPFLVLLAEQQGALAGLPPERRAFFLGAFGSLTFRLALFLGAQAAFTAWMALSWPTRAWAGWKGIGLPLTLFLYLGIEGLWFRRKVR